MYSFVIGQNSFIVSIIVEPVKMYVLQNRVNYFVVNDLFKFFRSLHYFVSIICFEIDIHYNYRFIRQ